MFFILSKTISVFAAPLVIICILLLLAAFLRKPGVKKNLFRTGLILLLFFTNDILSNSMLQLWEVPAIRFADIKKHYTWGIVLTGVTHHETGPKDRIYFSRGADRVTHALQLYKLGIIKKILISGGSGRLIDIGAKEANDVASVFIMMGIPEQDLVIENTSRNTHENAVNSVKILKNISTPEDCLLITSAYHMRRARACFAKCGWRMDVFSTDFMSHTPKFTPDNVIVPHIESMESWNTMIKEWVGFIAYFASGYV